jgi:hypothetical protein
VQTDLAMLLIYICNSINLKWFLLDFKQKMLVPFLLFQVPEKDQIRKMFRLWLNIDKIVNGGLSGQ